MELVTFIFIFLRIDCSVRSSDSLLEIFFSVIICANQSWVCHCRNMRNGKDVFSSVKCVLSNLEFFDTEFIGGILENFVFEGQLIVRQSSHAVGADLDRDVDGDVLCRQVLSLSVAPLIGLALVSC